MAPSPDTRLPLRKSLEELLREVHVPQKSENEWQKLENDLFLRLDAPQRPVRRFAFPFSMPSFAIPKPAIAWASAAVLALAVAGAGVAVSLMGGNSASVAGLVNVKGSVAVTWGGKGAPQTIAVLGPNEAARIARPKTVFETPEGGIAFIRLDKGSILSLAPRSRLTLEASGADRQICYLSTGSVLVKVSKRTPGQRFEIRTPCASCRVVGTVFQVNAQGEKQTTLSVFQGKVRLTPAAGIRGGETFVETGRQLTVGSGTEPAGRMLSAAQRPIHDISVLGMLVDENDNNGGILDIVSTPSGAKVLVNGAMAGKAPLMVKAAKGSYSLVLCSDGFQPLDTSVSLGYNRVCEVRAQLSQLAPAEKPAKIHAKPQSRRQPSMVNTETRETELQTMPDYIEALVDMSSGEYQAALKIFDSLSNSGLVDIKGRTCLMDKINACYAKLGDFGKASETLEDRYQKAQNAQDKGQLLWEMATMRANCLGDYQGAEMALVEFLILQPNAIWAHSAYGRLAEIQYYLNKYDVAAETYERHIATFPDDPDIDKSMFNLACILAGDLNNCDKAARWYSRLIDSFHASKYRTAAFFRRGECEMQMGKTAEAKRDFNACLAAAPQGAWREMCLSNIGKLKTMQ
jgi:TolA-binding protein